MKVKVIASGSKGNCTYIECGNIRFLIDIGINYLQLNKALEEINVSINEISFILITHTHNDHIKGLATLLKKTNIVLYSTTNIYEKLSETIEIRNYHVVDQFFSYDGIFPLSHDVECYGFIIKYDDKELVYITDTGYLNKRYYDILKNKDIYIIESNHDEKMLMDGPYPYILKQRVISDKGHLSNRYTGKFLNKTIGINTKYIVLAHLSENNNTEELALEQIEDELKNNSFKTKIIIAKQHIETEMVEI